MPGGLAGRRRTAAPRDASKVMVNVAVESTTDEATVTPSVDASADAPAPNVDNALHLGVMVDDVLSIQTALDSGISINSLGDNDETPLMKGVIFGNMIAIEYLLKAGAEVNFSNKHNFTALIAASWLGRTEIVTLLLEHKADLHYFGTDGYNALQWACQGKDTVHTDSVKVLLEHGMDPELRSIGGVLPMRLAASQKTRALLTEWIAKKQNKDEL